MHGEQQSVICATTWQIFVVPQFQEILDDLLGKCSQLCVGLL